jgi:hypothetical protein
MIEKKKKKKKKKKISIRADIYLKSTSIPPNLYLGTNNICPC